MPTLPSYDMASLADGQEGSRILPASTWHSAFRKACGSVEALIGFLFVPEGQEWLMRSMLREDVTCFSVDRIYRALLLEGDHAIIGRVDKPGPDATPEETALYEKSERARIFTQGWVDRLAYSFRDVLKDATEAKWFGHKLFEKEFGLYESELLPGAVAPIDYSPKPRTVYRFKVDRSNRVEGVVPANGKPEDLIPVSNLFCVAFDTMDRDPRGLPVAEPVYKTFRRNLRSFTNQDKASDQTGGGFIVVEETYPKIGVDGEAELYDQLIQVPAGMKQTGVDGEGNPVYAQDFTTISRQQLTAQIGAAAATGKTVAGLPGQTWKVLQGEGADIFDAALDRGERDVAKAYFGSARMLTEAQNGSKADTGVAENVGETARDHDRGILIAKAENEFRQVLAINFGEEYDDVVPRYSITTAESTDLEAVSNFLSANFDKLTTDQKNWLMSKAGAPLFPENWDPIGDQQEKAAEIAAKYAPEPAEEEPEAAFSALTEFATRGEITNRAAQGRVNRAVISADKQFRALVKRAYKGTLSETKFRTSFAYSLSVGHDRAFTFGHEHGGATKRTEEADTYIQETITSEADYANGLADAIFGETPISEAEANRRVRMYAKRLRGTANEAFRQASEGTGLTITWSLGANEDNCSECPTYAAMSPWEPEEMFAMPGDGSTPCKSNCRCSITRSDGRDGFGPVAFA